MLFFGIDPSLTGTGISVIDEDGYHDTILYGTVNKIKKGKEEIEVPIEERLIKISKEILKFVSGYGDLKNAKIFMEDIAYSKFGNSANKLVGLHYYIRVCLYDHNLNYEIVKSTTLKKFVLEKNNKKGAKKQQMLLHIYKRWNVEFNDDNKADAFALAQYGRYKNGFGEKNG